MMPTKRDNVIADVIYSLERGHLVPTFHAQEQMKKRNILLSDIEEALYQAQREEAKDKPTDDGKAWKYALRGLNEAGDKDLRIIVVFANPKVLIITAIDKNKKED